MKITVGLPVYNGSNYVAQALESILSQEGADFELLISEGGSTDGTANIIQRYAARDRRIRYEPTPGRLAQVENCNRIVELARTEWVHFMCHDDVLLPGALRRVRETLAAVPAAVALIGHSPATLYGNTWCYDAMTHGEKVFRWKPPENPFPQFSPKPAVVLFEGRFITERVVQGRAAPCLPALTNAVVRRQALLRDGSFNPGYAQFDTRAWLRLLIKHDYLFMPEPLSLTRIHGSQVTTQLGAGTKVVTDALVFWPAYLKEAKQHGVKLTVRSRWLPQLKAASNASASLYILSRRLKWQHCWAFFIRLPPVTRLVALGLFLRTVAIERRRMRPVERYVRLEDIYP